MQLVKQSTAATLVVGPILDSTGAEYASAAIGDLSIAKHDASTLTALASAATLTYLANGMYALALTTGNTDTLGRCRISCNKSTYQMPPVYLMIVPATVYDAIVTNATNTTGGILAATATVSSVSGYVGSSGATINGTNVNTLSGHDPGATLASTTNITAASGVSLAADQAVNVTKWGGTAIASAYVQSNMAQINGTSIAGTSTQVANAFVTMFNVASPVFTAASVNQTGDSYARIGSTGSGLTSLAPASTALSTATWTGTLATNLGTLASHDPGTTLGTSTLTQAQVTGGAYALNSASFAFNAALDFTTTQKAATLARVTLVDTLTTYTGNTPQTGDSYAVVSNVTYGNSAIHSDLNTVGTNVGNIYTDTQNLVARITSSLFVGITSLANWLGALAGKTADASTQTEIRATTAGATYTITTDSQEALRDRGDAAWTTATGFSTLDAAGVRSAIGMASANLDNQLDAIPTNSDLATSLAGLNNLSAAQVWSYSGRTITGGTIDTYTGNTPQTGDAYAYLTANVGANGANLTAADDATLAAIAGLSIPSATTIADAVLSRNVSNVEGSAGEHTLCTIVLAGLESSISGTTWTIKRTDGTTTHATKTVTTDSAAQPVTGVS